MRDAASKADDVREERKAEEAEWCQHGFSHRRCEACLRAEIERLEAEVRQLRVALERIERLMPQDNGCHTIARALADAQETAHAALLAEEKGE